MTMTRAGTASRMVAVAAAASLLVAGCGAARRSPTATQSDLGTAATDATGPGNGTSSTAGSRAGTSAAGHTGAGHTSTAPRSAATTRPGGLNGFGPWTVAIVDVDGTRLGAVTIGMTTAQAEQASGIPSWTSSGGYFRPARMRPGFDQMFFRVDGSGRVNCMGAQQVGPIILGQRIQTTSNVGVGDPVQRLRMEYGNQLVTVAKPSSGPTPSAGYVLNTAGGGRISFATDDGRTHITGIGVGPAVTPSTCP